MESMAPGIVGKLPRVEEIEKGRIIHYEVCCRGEGAPAAVLRIGAQLRATAPPWLARSARVTM